MARKDHKSMLPMARTALLLVCIFSFVGNRCPLHSGTSQPQPYQHQHSHLEASRFPQSTDVHYLSRPYGYLLADNQYLVPYPRYYSSHMYLPSSYLSIPYLNSNLYSSKHLPPSYQQRRMNSFDYSNSMRLYPEQTSSRCKGYLVVLAIILTVITIGVIMGILLAVSIN